MKQKSVVISILLLVLINTSCTDLNEKYEGNLTAAQVNSTGSNIDALFISLNNSLKNPFQNPFGGVIALSEITTDELIAPTRGPDWYDNGTWTQLHQHSWNGNHSFLEGCFNDLNGIVFAANDLLRLKLTPQQEAEARFFRAWAMYWVLDLFDQVPYRDPGENTLQPSRVRKGTEALNYIVNEINAVMANLADAPATKPTKNAAKVFLMKCYLNKGVYANRQSPTFAISDMNEVIGLADEVLNSNQYTFNKNYFDNFAPNNTLIGTENIFTQENKGGVFANSLLMLYSIGALHYNSTPWGFNGWATLSNFYDKFEEKDKRRGQAFPLVGLPNPGNRVNIGFLEGQQYNLANDEPLSDGSGNPLIFTRDVKIIETGSTLQVAGVRPQKYGIDLPNRRDPFNSPLDNDWVYFRLPDVLLMKAEAIMRGGTATNGIDEVQLVNAIRTHPSRGASALASIDFNTLLDERGRELWLECWRRQDLIRFGKFLQLFQEKEYVSDAKYLVFPIPNQQLGVNKNLVQNTGY